MQFETKQDEIIFCTKYGIPIRNIWHLLQYAFGEIPIERLGNVQGVENAPSIDALFAMLLCKFLQQRMRIGLGRNYIDEKHLLRQIRGKILFTDCVKHQTLQQGQAYCQSQEFSINVPKNQIIRSTLIKLNQIGQFGPDVDESNKIHHTLRRLIREMENIDVIELKPEIIRRQQLGRNDQDYRLMLFLCELIILRHMPTDSSGSTYLPDITRDELVFHQIYERFVANFYRQNLPNWKVTPQKRLIWHESTINQYLPIMKPDLMLVNKNNGDIIILDTKFTKSSLIENQYANQTFNSSHLYQLYAYLKTQEHLSEKHARATGILLYPTVSKIHLAERISIQDQNFLVQTIDLSMPWQDIECKLIDTIELAHM